MKTKIKILIVIGTITLLAIPAINNVNMFNRFKKGFYFEKYKNADQAKEALLKLHPVGSDVKQLIKTLDIATSNKKVFDKSMDNIKNRISKHGNYIYFDYIEYSIPFISNYMWRVVIDIDDVNHNKIKKIQIASGFDTL